MRTAHSVHTKIWQWFAAGVLASLLSFVPAPAATASAQNASFVGIVVGDSGRRLANAEVLLTNLDRSTRTDSAGRFRFADIKAGRHKLVVRLVGYDPLNITVTFDPTSQLESEVQLVRSGTTLATVDVKGSATYNVRMARFDEHRQRPGRFLTADIFQKDEGRPLASIITAKLSGIRVMKTGGKEILASSRNGGGAENCYMQIILNNLNVSRGFMFDINSIRAMDVIGLEFYSSSMTPSEYNVYASDAACGTVVIWTRN